MKNVAFVCFNHADRYSGGRMHALYLAFAFAKAGYEVDLYTNEKPIFYDDIARIFGETTIRLIVNKYFLWRRKRKDYIHVVFPPHVGRRRFADVADKLLIYPFVRRLKRNVGTTLWLLDFESPEWKSEIDDTVMHGYRNVIGLMKYVDVVLSTTRTGEAYARRFYGKLNPHLKFKQLYLCINSSVADRLGYQQERQDRAVVFFRTGEAHKNNESIVNMVRSLPRGFSLLLLGRFRESDENFIHQLKMVGEEHGISIEQESKVSEERKFEILATSRLLFFSSKFEGYGLPPVEAQYVGTPVVCSKLPVLREVNKYAEFADFTNLPELKSAVLKALSVDKTLLHDTICVFANISTFCNRLKQIALSIENRGEP